MKNKGRIFMLDDDELIISMLARGLQKEGYVTQVQTSTDNIIQKISSWHPDLLLFDIDLGDEQNGLDILAEVKQEKIMAPVVMLTADDTAESAIRAMKLGAADYLTKPFNMEEVKIVIENILENARLKEEVCYLRKTGSACAEVEMIGESDSVMKIKKSAEMLATAQVQTILITGESGTGKEVLARNIHHWSHAKNREETGDQQQPFIAVNCTALPESLVESELFGHVKGAFTDAKVDKKGVFEMADGGTLLLDEIGDMRLDLQSKFLRVLEDRKVRRLGGKVDLPVELMVIATTNKELKPAVKDGEFRQDLFYRLSTFAIHLPPLRERKEDIPPLARFFLDFFTQKYAKKQLLGFSPEAETVLTSYHWPGNIRELRNVIERCVVLENTDLITPDNLPADLSGRPPVLEKMEAGRLLLPEEGISLEEVEKDLIRQALERVEYNQTKAAKLLNISYDTLRYQVKKYGLKQ
jgi:DNA-binding NtrC family response regulator